MRFRVPILASCLLLLSAALAGALGYNSNGFEGFTAGALNGQNGWTAGSDGGASAR